MQTLNQISREELQTMAIFYILDDQQRRVVQGKGSNQKLKDIKDLVKDQVAEVAIEKAVGNVLIKLGVAAGATIAGIASIVYGVLTPSPIANSEYSEKDRLRSLVKTSEFKNRFNKITVQSFE